MPDPSKLYFRQLAVGEHLVDHGHIGEGIHGFGGALGGDQDIDITYRVAESSEAAAVLRLLDLWELEEGLDDPVGDGHRLGDRGSFVLSRQAQPLNYHQLECACCYHP